MNIYKLADEKWHTYRSGVTTECGADMNTWKEKRMIGKGRYECEQDPDVSTVCPKCFKFLPQFQKI